jgi:hypothetical protein
MLANKGITKVKEGKYAGIPDKPADIEQLWYESQLLDPADLPTWIWPEDAHGYRYVGYASGAELLTQEQKRYFAELEELEAAGLIVDRDPNDRYLHHIYIPAPWWDQVWSIGIYVGKSPFDFATPPNIGNPVLTRDCVTDASAVFIADPFMLLADDTWHMFFEVMNWRTGNGEIGLALSENGMEWTYQQIVLAEPFHLSYPYVFEWMGDYYMIPERPGSGSIGIYKASNFPTQWSFVGDLIGGPYLADPSIVRYDDKWWLFTETNLEEMYDTLRLYYADELMGPWREHAKSPIIEGNPRVARPGGRVLVVNDTVIRYAQNCNPNYGTDVRALEVVELTTTTYREREVDQGPVLKPSGTGWNARGMHHCDPHLMHDGRWIACVDGWSSFLSGSAPP